MRRGVPIPVVTRAHEIDGDAESALSAAGLVTKVDDNFVAVDDDASELIVQDRTCSPQKKKTRKAKGTENELEVPLDRPREDTFEDFYRKPR